jgi:transposase
MQWLGRHPRFSFHFTPTSCSWINAVEGFFATLTKRRLKRGVFRSITDLQAAINRYLAEHNENPKPFVWKADPKTSQCPGDPQTPGQCLENESKHPNRVLKTL